MKFFYSLLAGSFLLFLGCEPQQQSIQQKHFDFEAEIKSLSTKNLFVIKRISKDYIPQVVLDTVDFSKELAYFTEANLAKPATTVDFNAETIVLNDSTIRKVYTATNEKSKLRWVEYLYEHDVVTQVSLQTEEQSFAHNFTRSLVYKPGKYYSIVLQEKIKMSNATLLEIEGFITDEKPTVWQANFDLGQEKLPVNFYSGSLDKSSFLVIQNGNELIPLEIDAKNQDSIHVYLPVFMSQFDGLLTNNTFDGQWTDLTRKDYHINLVANQGVGYRFVPFQEQANTQLAGKWEAYFGEEKDEMAIGIFHQKGNLVTGTFATETGDYRFLEGAIMGDSLKLSCFDGSHAFLFTAKIEKDGNGDTLLVGEFFSGNHYSTTWQAKRNESAQLRNPETLTFLKEGYSKFEFKFPDLDSTIVSSSDKAFEDKVQVVTLMGSWCPNCMDESRLLTEFYYKYHHLGLEITALAFERTDSFEKAKEMILKHQNALHVPYRFLIAGKANKTEAAAALPMLNHVMSFPTTIFIDRKGNVRKIFTGFYGPGTDNYYNQYKEELELFLEKLLAEG